MRAGLRKHRGEHRNTNGAVRGLWRRALETRRRSLAHGEPARRTQWVRRRQAWVCCVQAAGTAWAKVQGHGGAQCLSASSLWDHVLPHPVHSGLMSSSRKADSHSLPSRSDPPPPPPSRSLPASPWPSRLPNDTSMTRLSPICLPSGQPLGPHAAERRARSPARLGVHGKGAARMPQPPSASPRDVLAIGGRSAAGQGDAKPPPPFWGAGLGLMLLEAVLCWHDPEIPNGA